MARADILAFIKHVFCVVIPHELPLICTATGVMEELKSQLQELDCNSVYGRDSFVVHRHCKRVYRC